MPVKERGQEAGGLKFIALDIIRRDGVPEDGTDWFLSTLNRASLIQHRQRGWAARRAGAEKMSRAA
jgi:hypothetical protein